jgi:hypothetical protein
VVSQVTDVLVGEELAGTDGHETIGLAEWKRSHQDAADDAEDGGVGAGAEGQQQDRGGREAGTSEHGTNRESQSMETHDGWTGWERRS